jgi:hypothetical protein
MADFDKSKYNELCKFFSKTEKRYVNVKAYTYDSGDVKISLSPTVKNSNEDCDPEKKWINQKGISGFTIEEAKLLVKALESTIAKAEEEVKK